MSRPFRLVDVFGEHPLTGNPLAVVVDGHGLDTEEMLELTRWLGFSETTFILPPISDQADYRVRIFTLIGELPFAGHPTLGTCHVWRSLQDDPADVVVQECGVGLVPVRRDGDILSFRAPPLLRDGPVDPGFLSEVATVLGVGLDEIDASRWVDNGPGWVGVRLASADAVVSLRPDFNRYTGDGNLDIGVVGFHPEGSEILYEVRAFFSDQNGKMQEDPVTGSLNASLAQWLLSDGETSAPYVAAQGQCLGRSGRIHIDREDEGEVWVGGRVFDVVEGVW